MTIPTLEQLERALHIRGAIETLQSELSSLLGGLADVVAPSTKRNEPKPKGPFADSQDGARRKRRKKRTSESGPVESPSAKLSGRNRSRKARVKAAQKARLKNILTGGEVGSAPVATEPKSHGRKSSSKAPKKKRKMSAAAQKDRRAKVKRA